MLHAFINIVIGVFTVAAAGERWWWWWLVWVVEVAIAAAGVRKVVNSVSNGCRLAGCRGWRGNVASIKWETRRVR